METVIYYSYHFQLADYVGILTNLQTAQRLGCKLNLGSLQTEDSYIEFMLRPGQISELEPFLGFQVCLKLERITVNGIARYRLIDIGACK